MEKPKIIEIIEEVLKNSKIEILNIADPNDNNILLSFLFKGKHCYITTNGRLSINNLNKEDTMAIKKLILFAQNKANIDTKLPIQNIDTYQLEKRVIENEDYYLLVQIKNICLFYRVNGILGINYIVCEQFKIGDEYRYKNINRFTRLNIAEQYLSKRACLIVKPFNVFNEEELKEILYFIENYKNNDKSKNMKISIENIQNKIIDLLKV